MNTNVIKTEPACIVVGIATRTTNAAEFQGAGVIPSLWQRFFSKDILSKIPHKIDTTIMALYYNFVSDKHGAYDILLGARVSAADNLPEGFVTVHIPEEKRIIFTTEKGSMPHIVIKTWHEIWALEDQKKLNRAYQFDYELYDARSADPANAQVEIHIGTIE